MAIFKAELASQIQTHFDIRIDPLLDILDLTSTRSNKFSRHLIVKIPGAVFKSFLDVSAFVKQMISSIEIRVIEGDKRLGKLFVTCSSRTPTPTIFIDSSVYSKVSLNLTCTQNRQFRLIDSSKIGSTSKLTLCNSQDEIGESSSANHAPSFETFADSLVCPIISDSSIRVLECAHVERPTRTVTAIPSTPRVKNNGVANSSPFPEIDASFIEALRKQGTQPDAYIASSIYYPDSLSLVYTIGGSRYLTRDNG
jgi:hypothetical protein